MAEVVNSMPSKRDPLDDFEKYLDGQVWKLLEGVDFTNAESVRNKALRAAGNMGKKATVQKRGKAIYIQATPKGEANGSR